MFLHLHDVLYLSCTEKLQRPLLPFILAVDGIVVILVDFETVDFNRSHWSLKCNVDVYFLPVLRMTVWYTNTDPKKELGWMWVEKRGSKAVKRVAHLAMSPDGASVKSSHRSIFATVSTGRKETSCNSFPLTYLQVYFAHIFVNESLLFDFSAIRIKHIRAW